MTVTQYEYCFMELSHFAPVLVADQEERCEKFLDGLRPEVGHTVAATNWTIFGNLVESAKRVEQSITEQRRRQDRGQKMDGQQAVQGENSSQGQGKWKKRFFPGPADNGNHGQARSNGQGMISPQPTFAPTASGAQQSTHQSSSAS
ncbi:hypothetical protein CFOL_v3_27754 [Cephalotus follicularis]|uniref:Uncharacterized protein n=1 Tax=Cephalotus follicularis TaxID=3775 RepID=A0A1Q3CVQ4_CEPFO|nr:hypothetical protein CFOL_v3_27754 [Cephalotus follicularis]